MRSPSSPMVCAVVPVGLTIGLCVLPQLSKLLSPNSAAKGVPSVANMIMGIFFYVVLIAMLIRISLSIWEQPLLHYFGLDKKPRKPLIRLGLGWGVCALVAVLFTGWCVSAMAKLLGWTMPLQDTFTCLLQENTPLSLRLLLVALVVFLVPFCEELLFRGVLLRGLLRILHLWRGEGRERNFPLAVFLSGCIFSVAHGHLLLIPQLFLFHLFLSYVYRRTESLIPSMIMHALFNGINLLLFTLFYTSAS